MHLSATYSPEDNKLRLYASQRLDAETYTRVKAAGFSWAPRQELFVAPAWTPGREDLLVELCGEIGDEDTSLVDRAEQRAERFEDYSDRRAEDANAAKEAVDRIADGIPLGQPILVGHHSEKRARKDAERITTGMRRAVKMWEQSGYWKQRAAGAIRAAKYKELPTVRHRRIKTLEADKRAQERHIAEAERKRGWWEKWNATEPHDADTALRIADLTLSYETYTAVRDGTMTPEDACTRALESFPRIIAHAQRWIDHLNNRLEYERAMLAEAGGTAADRFEIKPGGRVLVGGEWLPVIRVNKSGGAVNSVTTVAPSHVTWTKQWKYGIEKVKDYREPDAAEEAKAKAATKLHPLCNFPSEGCREMTAEEWKRSQRASDSYFVQSYAATETTGAYRRRTAHGPNWTRIPVFITDEKRKDPPKLDAKPAEPVTFERQYAATPERPAFNQEVQFTRATPEEIAKALDFEAMRETLKAGVAVQVVSAPQLFPTPADLARRMVDAADLQPWQTVLEPSAGTGAILRAIEDAAPMGVSVQAVEINPQLSASLHTSAAVRCADFLACNGDLGTFDRIVMNPPFADSQDIEHVRHAYHMLREGGRLVAIMSEGPFFRQDRKATEFRAWLDEIGGTSEQLPPDTFKESGTGVNTRLVVIDR